MGYGKGSEEGGIKGVREMDKGNEGSWEFKWFTSGEISAV